MRPRALAAVACTLAAIAGSAAASGITLRLNHTVRLPVTGSAASVVVGNPAIADVSVVDSHTVFAIARGYGTTDVTVIDSLGRTVFSSEIEVAPAARGQVALYRGGQRSDLACDPTCSTNSAAAPAPYRGGASSPAGASAPNSALAAGLVAGALIGAASHAPLSSGGPMLGGR